MGGTATFIHLIHLLGASDDAQTCGGPRQSSLPADGVFQQLKTDASSVVFTPPAAKNNPLSEEWGGWKVLRMLISIAVAACLAN